MTKPRGLIIFHLRKSVTLNKVGMVQHTCLQLGYPKNSQNTVADSENNIKKASQGAVFEGHRCGVHRTLRVAHGCMSSKFEGAWRAADWEFALGGIRRVGNTFPCAPMRCGRQQWLHSFSAPSTPGQPTHARARVPTIQHDPARSGLRTTGHKRMKEQGKRLLISAYAYEKAILLQEGQVTRSVATVSQSCACWCAGWTNVHVCTYLFDLLQLASENHCAKMRGQMLLLWTTDFAYTEVRYDPHQSLDHVDFTPCMRNNLCIRLVQSTQLGRYLACPSANLYTSQIIWMYSYIVVVC